MSYPMDPDGTNRIIQHRISEWHHERNGDRHARLLDGPGVGAADPVDAVARARDLGRTVMAAVRSGLPLHGTHSTPRRADQRSRAHPISHCRRWGTVPDSASPGANLAAPRPGGLGTTSRARLSIPPASSDNKVWTSWRCRWPWSALVGRVLWRVAPCANCGESRPGSTGQPHVRYRRRRRISMSSSTSRPTTARPCWASFVGWDSQIPRRPMPYRRCSSACGSSSGTARRSRIRGAGPTGRSTDARWTSTG